MASWVVFALEKQSNAFFSGRRTSCDEDRTFKHGELRCVTKCPRYKNIFLDIPEEIASACFKSTF